MLSKEKSRYLSGKKLVIASVFLIINWMLISFGQVEAEVITYSDSWGNSGYNLDSADELGVEITFSITEFSLEDREINGEIMQTLHLPGAFLPNEAGAPDLPSFGRYIAIPQGASASVQIIASRQETFQDIDIAPAFRIPLETEEGPLEYTKDPDIYSTDAFYPDEPVIISEPMQIRGVDAVILGITPFQYNPVTKELVVYRDLKVDVTFDGGNGYFGEDRLRSRWWDPILRDILLNYASLPEINYNHTSYNPEEFEYLIIIPDDPTFEAWADSIKVFRTLHGIRTGVVTTTEIGGNTHTAIENYIDNAYTTWDTPPVAVLLLADYGETGNTIISPTWNNYCISDNIYADVNGDDLPDIAFARITAQDEDDLSTMIEKALNYERTPPTDPDFYNHPVVAGGWQSDRWFILCTEIIHGFWENVLDKSPVREYAGYSDGYAPPYWSTNPNTDLVVDYFGPDGLGYIPETPSHLTDWGGNADRINNDINSGAFMILHRDHGGVTGWSQPSYHISDLAGLENDGLTYVFSINCLTGKFNSSGECFAEAFHRHEKGALGITAATAVSYSFVNDTYVWGMYDNMWPDFDPGYGGNDFDTNFILPCFANAAGKYYLAASGWPYNPQMKNTVYYLFHHHGDAFTTIYSEVPQELAVAHDPFLHAGVDFFTITANEGSFIALTVNGEIIGTGEGTGTPINITIPPQSPGDTMIVTITKQNYYCYCEQLPIIPVEDHKLLEEGWNWVSFPVLPNPAGTNALEVLEPILDTLILDKVVYEGREVIYYFKEHWVNRLEDGNFRSIEGYKIKMKQDAELVISGVREEPETPIPLLAEKENWIGYFLGEPLLATDAFANVWDEIKYIRARKWAIYEPWAPPRVAVIPGELYIVGVTKDCTLIWGSGDSVEPDPRPLTLVFDYQEQADYMPIFVDSTEALAGIDEIGVFLEDECIGASVIDGYPLFIPAYIEDEDSTGGKDYGELIFQVATYGKGEKRTIPAFVYNPAQDAFVEEPVILDRKSHAVVRLGTGEGTESPKEFALYQNHPNPVTTSTTISFIPSPGAESSEIKIYNIKGQLVKQFKIKNLEFKINEATWDGKDAHGRQVANGIYFYKVTSGDKTAVKKMLVLH